MDLKYIIYSFCLITLVLINTNIIVIIFSGVADLNISEVQR